MVMNRYSLGLLISIFLCVACAALASKSSLYSLYDIGSYLFASIAMGCLLGILEARGPQRAAGPEQLRGAPGPTL